MTEQNSTNDDSRHLVSQTETGKHEEIAANRVEKGDEES